ncbi:shikimate dehydrogenase [Caulobacter mirabilis]|uniref:Shikimate dehydrogenase (NADP(+)) n=1 Tax=Caulobacter mirabilis TaxID=69666 RepID=A0A2D2B305_9CAUL|nr:shikimate dehydrogenase [Caulobacter mirabilis]ATQ44635.1 shikimate dehydrogenase [Caulobacter mirabilis]
MSRLTGAAMVAGVAGRPVTHSLSPLLHNAWIAAAGLDAVYVPLSPPEDGFRAFADGLRGGVIQGVNVTIPFKEDALAVADERSQRALLAGAANLLLFRENGTIYADNTDGLGMLGALAAQASGFDPKAGPAVVLGAGGAARGAAAALSLAGAPEVRILNRSADRAEALARDIGGTVKAVPRDGALAEANLIVNATSLGLGGGGGPDVDLGEAPGSAVVLDMVYKPLRTEFLQRAAARGLRTADGLEMLIRQAVPSFEAFFGVAPPESVDVRGLALNILGEGQ